MNNVGVGNYRRTVRHRSVDGCRPAQRALCLCQDGKEGIGGEFPAVARPDWPPTGFTGAHFLPAIGSPVRVIRPSAGPAPLVLLPSLGTRGGLVFKGLVRWISSHGSEFQRSDGMFGNSQSFGDREVTWERVYPSSRVPPLRFLAWRFLQIAPIVVS